MWIGILSFPMFEEDSAISAGGETNEDEQEQQ
jgi:hypothetical protein